MKGSLFAGIVAALALTGTAGATSTSASRDMAQAMKALHYPKAGAPKMACRGSGPFSCKATYRHHRVRRFQAEWKGQGGWICAGTHIASCKILRHGFVTTAAAQPLAGAAEEAAVGVMQNRYDTPVPFVASPCQQAGTSTWTCGYKGANDTTIKVAVTLKKVKAGYTITATSTAT